MKHLHKNASPHVLGLFVILLAAPLTLAPARAATLPKADVPNLLTDPASWVGGAVPGPADQALWDGTIVTPANCFIALGGSTNWGGIVISNPPATVEIPDDGSVLTLGAMGVDMSGASQNLTLDCALSLGASQAWNVAPGFTLTITNVVGDGGGGYGLTNFNGGTVTLSGGNTFGGGITLSNGFLHLNNAGALGTGPFTIFGGTIDDTSGGDLVNANNNAQNWNGSFGFAGTANLNLGSGAVSLPAAATITVNANTLTAGGSISGAGGINALDITKAGNGTLALTANVTTLRPSQTNTVNAGTLSLSGTVSGSPNLNALDIIKAGNGTLLLSNNVALRGSQMAMVTGGKMNVAGVISDGGNGYGLTNAGAGTLILSGTNTYTGLTVASGGTLQIGNAGTSGSTATNILMSGGGLTYSRTDNFTQAGFVSGNATNGTLLDSGTTAGNAALVNLANGSNSFGGLQSTCPGTFVVAGSSNSTNVFNGPLNIGTGSTLVFAGGNYSFLNSGLSGGNGSGKGSCIITNGSNLYLNSAQYIGWVNFSISNASVAASAQYEFNALNGVVNIGPNALILSTNYAFVFGSHYGAGAAGGAQNNCTVNQFGGIIQMNGNATFNLGGQNAGYTDIYNMSGGTISAIGQGSAKLTLGADPAGTTTTRFSLTGGKVMVSATLAGGANSGTPRQIFDFSGGTVMAGTIDATWLSSANAPTTYGTLVNNGGTLAPGDLGKPGRTIITGNYLVTSPSAVLAIDLGGTTQASTYQATTNVQYDFVSVSGSASLGGQLAINLLSTNASATNLFIPATNNAFTIMTAAGGFPIGPTNFATYNGYIPAYTNGLLYVGKYFRAQTIGNNLVLTNFNTAPEPVASFVVTNSIGVAPYTVAFTDTSTGVLTNRHWNFGDTGTVDTMATTVSHTWVSPGTYAVVLSVISPDNTLSSATGTVVVASSAGPLLTWTGAKNNTWDSSTTNWINGGTPMNFTNLDGVAFDDTSAVTNVSLTINAFAASVSFNAVNKNYFLSGSGKITGGAGLTVGNTGPVTLLTVNDYTGATTINAGGTLQAGNGASTGSFDNSSAINDSGTLIFNQPDNHTIGATITGAGALVKVGAGTLTLTANNSATFTGAVTNNGGTLAIAADTALGQTGGAVVLSNATLQVNSSTTLNRTLMLGGTNDSLNPGLNATVILPNSLVGTAVVTVGGSGTLQVDTGGASVSLPTNVVLSGGSLAYARYDNYTQPGVISGTSTNSSINDFGTAQGNTNTLTFASGVNLFGNLQNYSVGDLALTSAANSTNILYGTLGMRYTNSTAGTCLEIDGGVYTLTNAPLTGATAAAALGTLAINNGTVNAIMAGTGGGARGIQGNLTLNGGALYVGGGGLSMAAANTQVLTINGGLLQVNSTSQGIRLGNAAGATGAGNGITCVQTNGTVCLYANALDLGNNTAGKTVSYLLSGGSVLCYSNTGFNLGAYATNTSSTTFTITNSGTLVVSGSITGAQASAQSLQVLALAGGTLAAGAINATWLRDSATDPYGTLVNNGGTFAPGNLGIAGRTLITGNFAVNNSASLLAIDIGGVNQATNFATSVTITNLVPGVSTNIVSVYTNLPGFYDNVAVSGSAAVLGRVSANLISGFTPVATNSFTILAATNGLAVNLGNLGYNGFIPVSTNGVTYPGTYFNAVVNGNRLVLTNYGVAPASLAASFTPNNVIRAVGSPVVWTDTSTGVITNRQWNFGDPSNPTVTNTTVVNVSYAYANPGTYTNVLTITDINGATSSATGLVMVASSGAILTWTGANSTAWDAVTTNWSASGVPSLYADPDDVTFDDTSTRTNVTLNLTVAPSTITFNSTVNNYAYTLGGSGNISGTTGLTLNSGGGLTLLTTNFFTGAITINNSSTLQVGNGTNSGGIDSASSISDNGALIFNQTDNDTLVEPISGGGSLSSLGSGTLTLTANNSGFSGPVTINGGVLAASDNTGFGTTAALTLGQGGLARFTSPSTFPFNYNITLTVGGGGIDHVIPLTMLGITGSGPFIKAGSGTMTFTNGYSYGNTIITGGTLVIGTNGSTSGSIALNGGSLTYSLTNNFNQAGFISGNATSGTLQDGGTAAGNTALLTLASGSNSFGGLKSSCAGTMELTASPGTINSFNGGLSIGGGGTLVFGGGSFQFLNPGFGNSGQSGNGNCSITNGANVWLNNGSWLGWTNVMISGANSTLMAASQFELNAANGVFTLASGGILLATNGSVLVGSHYGPGTASGAQNNYTLNQNGGTVQLTGNSTLGVGGQNPGYSDVYNLSGGTVLAVGPTAANLTLGADSGGTGLARFSMTGSGKVVVNGTISAAVTTGTPRQIFDFSGGTLVAGALNATGLTSTNAPTTMGTLVNNGGTLAPGDMGLAGRTTVNGNYVVSNNAAVLDIDIGGTNQAAVWATSIQVTNIVAGVSTNVTTVYTNVLGYYDNVTLGTNGSAVLGGSLNLRLISGFEPWVANNNQFVILSATNVTGAFTNVASGAWLNVQGYTNRSFRVNVTATNVYLDAYQTPTLQGAFAAETPVVGPVPLSVTFSNLSNGAITASVWNFGDGVVVTNNAGSVTHTYNTPGTNTVTLTISGASGSSTLTQTNYIQALSLPVAQFTASTNNGVAPLTVNFSAAGSTGSGGLTTGNSALWDWDWVFGDGNSDLGESSPTDQHIYTSAGTYTVQLTVTDLYFASATTNLTIVVTSAGPSGPPTLTNSVIGSSLILSWGQGWQLAVQTNTLANGLGNNWVTNATATSPFTNNMNPANGSVFYKLVNP